MTSLWIVRFCILMLLQIITSFALIYNNKKRISYFTEIFLTVASMLYAYFLVPIIIENIHLELVQNVYNNNSFTKDKFWWYIMEYLIFKILFLYLIWILRYFSFYALVSITKKNGKIAKIGYKLFGEKRFQRFTSKMWNKVNYGIKIKKGLPGMINKKHKSTGVYFDEDGFPKFKAFATVKLPTNLYNKSREVHSHYCNKALYKKIISNKRVANKFTEAEKQSFKEGKTPIKFIWHHHQDEGVMKLVDRKIHEKVSHNGGFSIWGKKEN